jgi:small-conductance mechanosensitive channel
VVKNRIYANTWARIHVAVKVGLESDIGTVESAMLAAVAEDPRILPTPRPRVLLSTIGDTALEFELVAVLASVETGPAVRSDLNKRIITSFREAGIRLVGQAVPAPPATVVVTLDEALRAIDGARSADGLPQS